MPQETYPKNLVEGFNEWADDRILDYEDMPDECLEKWRPVRQARIDTLRFAKINLERLARKGDEK